jgi:hypothetical protein
MAIKYNDPFIHTEKFLGKRMFFIGRLMFCFCGMWTYWRFNTYKNDMVMSKAYHWCLSMGPIEIRLYK